jgi:hypothetical protein
VSDCFHGFGEDSDSLSRFGWRWTDCFIGTEDHWGKTTYLPTAESGTDITAQQVVDDLATLLTSGRLSTENREVLKQAYDFTIDQGKGPIEAAINVQQLIVTSPEFHTTQTPTFSGENRTTPQSQPATGKPYKAIIYLMLSGGADSFNMLVPFECTGTNEDGVKVSDQYLEHRGSVAFDAAANEFDLRIAASGQPCTEFAMHDELQYVQSLYNAGHMSWVANVGVVNQNGMNKNNFNTKTKTDLFAHNAMQDETKKVDPYNDYTGTGVLGRTKDVLQLKGHVINSLSIDGSSVAVEGVPGKSPATIVVPRNGADVFAERSAGDKSYRPQDEYYLPIEDLASQMNQGVNQDSGFFADLFSQEFIRGITDSERLSVDLSDDVSPLNEALWGSEPSDDEALWDSLRTVAKLIKTHQTRNTDRDVFYGM